MTGNQEAELAIRRAKDDLYRSISSLDRSLDWAKDGGPACHWERKLLVQKSFRRFLAVTKKVDNSKVVIYGLSPRSTHE